jgi:hypothetical protein
MAHSTGGSAFVCFAALAALARVDVVFVLAMIRSPSGIRVAVRAEHVVTANARLAFRISLSMAKSIKEIQKRRGRPATGRDPMVGARFPPELTAAVDKWAAENAGVPRAEAIRRLVEIGLKAKGGKR